MNNKHTHTFLLVEDTPECAELQLAAMRYIFPHSTLIHVPTLEEARQVLNRHHQTICGVMTDNGFPVEVGGERMGSKSMEGGAGTMLVRLVRQGEMGENYQDLPIIWHTADIDDDKIEKVMIHAGHTKCFSKGEGEAPYRIMAEQLSTWLH